jgi:hypothetical protein
MDLRVYFEPRSQAENQSVGGSVNAGRVMMLEVQLDLPPRSRRLFKVAPDLL